MTFLFVCLGQLFQLNILFYSVTQFVGKRTSAVDLTARKDLSPSELICCMFSGTCKTLITHTCHSWLVWHVKEQS